ncbi:MAG TPA: DUF2157 domain-containing protein [Gemmatimonadales bacterium]|nr:DUF2157 domain-containing protein [Gemmatimonadales bacterium]
MAGAWEDRVGEWVEAGVLEPAAADRIRAWEAGRRGGLAVGWPVRLAVGLGGLLLCAGMLLFVAAHWDAMAPGSRFALVLLTLGAFHLAGAFTAERSPAVSTSLHACGTAALGGGIFLSGQIFHLSEHWPGGVLLWALGAWAGWVLLRDWPHVLLAALLTPAWLVGEWMTAATSRAGGPVLAVGLLSTALAYLGALPAPAGGARTSRAVLAWIGGIGLIPATLVLVTSELSGLRAGAGLSGPLRVAGWSIAIGAPLALTWWLRRQVSPPYLALAAWVVAGPWLTAQRGAAPYLWGGAFSLGLLAWGVIERRSERINLGVAGFAITVLVFYFSSFMDRLGRSASLVGLGLLFLGGGWALERGRRRLVARVQDDRR